MISTYFPRLINYKDKIHDITAEDQTQESTLVGRSKVEKSLYIELAL